MNLRTRALLAFGQQTDQKTFSCFGAHVGSLLANNMSKRQSAAGSRHILTVTKLKFAMILLGISLFHNCFAVAQEEDSSSPMSERVFAAAEKIFGAATIVHYEHLHAPAGEQVRWLRDGGCVAKDDCSGFVSFILHTVGKRHYLAIKEAGSSIYPKAKTYAQFFVSLTPGQASQGWLRVTSWRDLGRGDIIAWEKGDLAENHHGGNTGHVMIVAQAPAEPATVEAEGRTYRYVPVRVIDSSSVKHFPPESLPPNAGQEHRDGLGEGTIRLILGENDKVIGYWEGSYWGEGQKDVKKPSLSNIIGMARMVSLVDR